MVGAFADAHGDLDTSAAALWAHGYRRRGIRVASYQIVPLGLCHRTTSECRTNTRVARRDAGRGGDPRCAYMQILWPGGAGSSGHERLRRLHCEFVRTSGLFFARQRQSARVNGRVKINVFRRQNSPMVGVAQR